MAYLIDGNNFLGHISPSSRNTPRSRYNLIIRLLKFQRVKRTRIILVFDGSPDPNLMEKQLHRKRFSLLYPHPGESADERIKEVILKETDLRRFYVVSSDRALQRFARSKGAKTLYCEEFKRELTKALRAYNKAQDEEKNIPSPSSLEITQWLEVFSGKND